MITDKYEAKMKEQDAKAATVKKKQQASESSNSVFSNQPPMSTQFLTNNSDEPTNQDEYNIQNRSTMSGNNQTSILQYMRRGQGYVNICKTYVGM